PFWDVLLYPIQALSDVGERDHVEVVRISPRDEHRIPVMGDPKQKKLVGAEKGHFGAFLSRRGREQDYLWGRLDGAERYIRILLADAEEADVERWCNEAFAAVLEEDEQAVPKAAPLVAHVRETIKPSRATCQTPGIDLRWRCGPASGEEGLYERGRCDERRGSGATSP